MLKDAAILKRLVAIKEIPTLPEVLEDVLAALSSERSSADDLAKILSKDQALSSRILKIANSAYFAQSRRISVIEEAVVLLGFDSIAHLTLAASVFRSFQPMRPQESFDLYGFWKHSIAAATASRLIADAAGKPDEAKMVYTAGLLHDIGKLVLVTYFLDRYSPVLKKLASEQLYVHEAEMAELGFTHCDVSEWLCNRWNFPEKLIDAIARHHEAASLCGRPEPRIVRLANILCNQMKLGDSGNTRVYPLHPEDHSIVSLNEEAVRKIIRDMENREREIEIILTAIS
ncbi:MAG: HDOD domain-containing protein [Candidatus Abyssubacteria bacterium]